MNSITSNFEKVFGHSPDICASAPGRVNLIGEHIDFSEGFVLPFAINDCTDVAIAKTKENTIKIASVQRNSEVLSISISDISPDLKGDWERYVLGVIWSLGITTGLEIFIDGKVPVGAGLSSSAALEASVATALNSLFSLGHDLPTLARLCQKAENDYVGMPCGIMDQSVSLMAEKGSALLLDCRNLSTKNISFDVASHGLELLIIDTQVHHELVDGGYAERRASCDSVVSKLKIVSMRHLSIDELLSKRSEITDTEFIRAHHAVTEIKRVLDAVIALEKNDFVELGKLINASHDSLRDDYTVSCPELDSAVDASLAAGALGARMVGGGFGGSAIALVIAQNVESTKLAIQSAFESKGYKAPRFFTSLPSQGARIL
jgi:galactokinase